MFGKRFSALQPEPRMVLFFFILEDSHEFIPMQTVPKAELIGGGTSYTAGSARAS